MWEFFLIDPFHNDVISFEILPGTSLASIHCGSKSQKRALLSAKHDIVLYVWLRHNNTMWISRCTGNHIFCLELNVIVKGVYSPGINIKKRNKYLHKNLAPLLHHIGRS